MRAMSRYAPLVVAAVAGSITYSQVNTTSSAVNGLPSCHCTPFLSFRVTESPSRARPLLSIVGTSATRRSEEHTSELQSLTNLVCRLLLEKKKKNMITNGG